MGKTTCKYLNAISSKTQKLVILTPIRFDTPLSAAKETPKRVPKCLVFTNQKLAI